MSYRRFFVTAALACLACIGHAVAYVGSLIMAPLMYLVRDAPASALNLFVVTVSPIAFRVLQLLKPEYRESWLTDGHSLRAA